MRKVNPWIGFFITISVLIALSVVLFGIFGAVSAFIDQTLANYFVASQASELIEVRRSILTLSISGLFCGLLFKQWRSMLRMDGDINSFKGMKNFERACYVFAFVAFVVYSGVFSL